MQRSSHSMQRDSLRHMVWFLARTLLVCAIAEFVLLRILLRLGPILPEDALTTTVLAGASQAGLLSLNLAVVAGMAFMVALWISLHGSAGEVAPRLVRPALTVALAAALAGLVLPYVSKGAWGAVALTFQSVMSLLALFLLSAGLLSRRAMLPMAVALLALYSAAFYHYLGRASAALGSPLPGAGVSLLVAEVMTAFLAPALLLAIAPKRKVRALAAGAIAAIVYLGVALRMPWAASALAIWDFGFTSALPPYWYAVALGVLVYAIVTLIGSKQWAPAGAGLALMALGGLRVDYGYYTLLIMCGALLVTSTLLRSSADESVGSVGAGVTTPVTGRDANNGPVHARAGL